VLSIADPSRPSLVAAAVAVPLAAEVPPPVAVALLFAVALPVPVLFVVALPLAAEVLPLSVVALPVLVLAVELDTCTQIFCTLSFGTCFLVCMAQ